MFFAPLAKPRSCYFCEEEKKAAVWRRRRILRLENYEPISACLSFMIHGKYLLLSDTWSRRRLLRRKASENDKRRQQLQPRRLPNQQQPHTLVRNHHQIPWSFWLMGNKTNAFFFLWEQRHLRLPRWLPWSRPTGEPLRQLRRQQVRTLTTQFHFLCFFVKKNIDWPEGTIIDPEVHYTHPHV